MAELQFDYLVDLSQNYINTCIGNEPDNRLVQYGLIDDRQQNEATEIVNSNYSSLTWQYLQSLLSSQAVKKIGVKNFPQIGAIGFYTLLHENRSCILAPIFTESQLYKWPTMLITQNTNDITFTIMNPEDVVYDCWRVCIRQGYFAYEYVSYEQMFTVPKPPTGTYTFSVEGYLNDRLASEKYEQYDVSVVNPKPVPTPLGDTVYSVNSQVADINGNVTIEAQHIPFSADGFLAEDVLEAILEASAGATASIHTLAIIDWSSNQQTITVDGITATNIVLVAPIPAHQSGYTAANVICVSQGIDSLTFQCATIPLIDINVQVVIL